MIIRAVLLIAFIGNAEHGIGCIQADATLETTGRDVPAVSLHEHFLDEVFRALVQMGKTIDLFSG